LALLAGYEDLYRMSVSVNVWDVSTCLMYTALTGFIKRCMFPKLFNVVLRHTLTARTQQEAPLLRRAQRVCRA